MILVIGGDNSTKLYREAFDGWKEIASLNASLYGGSGRAAIARAIAEATDGVDGVDLDRIHELEIGLLQAISMAPELRAILILEPDDSKG